MARRKGRSSEKLSTEEQFKLDYAYVVKDLRSILILAVIMFALLIVLNIVLQGM